jgi:hypothetical protein
MANKKATLDDPELGPSSGSEIEACIDLSAVGNDGIPRPVFINQLGDETLALTIEDAERLLGFLQEAIQFINSQRNKTLQ